MVVMLRLPTNTTKSQQVPTSGQWAIPVDNCWLLKNTKITFSTQMCLTNFSSTVMSCESFEVFSASRNVDVLVYLPKI